MEPLVVLILFILFSVLNAFLDRKKKAEAEQEEALLRGEEEEATFTPAPRPRQTPAPREEDDAFAGWGAWPEEGEEEGAEAPVPAGWEPEPPRPAPREPVSDRWGSERSGPAAQEPASDRWDKGPTPVPVPVEVAREPAPVLVQTGRAGRWDGVVVRGAPVTIAPAAAEARQRRFHAATPPAEVARRGRPAPGPAVLQGLHEPERLRNAVVLAEVLGPPRALRGWDDPHRG